MNVNFALVLTGVILTLNTPSIAQQRCEGIEKAILGFDHEKLKEALENDSSCANFWNRKLDEYPLTLSARYDNLPATKLLLQFGAEPDIETFYGHESPMMIAAQRGKIPILLSLLNGNADINFRTKSGTALFQAAHYGQVSSVRFLLNKNANPHLINWEGYYPIHTAARMGHVDIVKIFIEEAEEKIDVLDNKDFQPIHRAALWNQVSVVNYLVSKGADVDAMTSDKSYSVLHIAARQGAVEVAKFLTEHGAKLNVRDINGETPLFIATAFNYTGVATVLIDAGADMRIETQWQGQKLGLFGLKASWGLSDPSTPKTCRLILEKKFPINYVYSTGRTALLDYTFLPVRLGSSVEFESYKGCLKLLVQYGSEVNAKDPFGHNAAYYIGQLPQLTAPQRQELQEIVSSP